jgi:hypothetical protein
MEKSTMHLIDDNVKRLGYKDKSKIFRENIKNSLVPFPQPIPETVNGVNYQIIAGFFNIFFTFLLYYCPTTEKYLYYGTHRESETIKYKENFPEGIPAFSTFDEAEEHIYESLKGAYEK